MSLSVNGFSERLNQQENQGQPAVWRGGYDLHIGLRSSGLEALGGIFDLDGQDR